MHMYGRRRMDLRSRVEGEISFRGQAKVLQRTRRPDLQAGGAAAGTDDADDCQPQLLRVGAVPVEAARLTPAGWRRSKYRRVDRRSEADPTTSERTSEGTPPAAAGAMEQSARAQSEGEPAPEEDTTGWP